MQGAPQPQSSSNHDNLISTFTLAIDGFNLAKDILSGTPAKAVVGSVGIILARIRDSLQNEDFLRIGTKCAYICSELGKSAGGKNPSSFSQPISEAIDRLEKTVKKIENATNKKAKRRRLPKFFHAGVDTQAIIAWDRELNDILAVFNAQVGLDTNAVATEILREVKGIKANDNTQSVQAPSSVPSSLPLITDEQTRFGGSGESPPPKPRACFGRDALIEELVRRAEELKPSALIGAGGTGKTVIASTVLHHERTVRKFSDQRRFIRCDEFPTSIVNFLDRLAAVIGAGVRNATSLAPLRPFITAQPMVLVLDNAETILDPGARDTCEIHQAVEELCQFPDLCLIITSRISIALQGCKSIQVSSLSVDDGRKIFYGIYPEGERSDLVDGLLKQLDCHPLSITILAKVASQKSWGYRRILKEWEEKKVQVLQTGLRGRDKCLTASIEVSLGSPTFEALGPGARDVLGVIAFFPQGINWEKLDWLFPKLPGVENMVDTFCMLSLVSRNEDRVTMLAPLREYLRPGDLKPPSLIWDVKEQYFSRLRLTDQNLRPGMPGFNKTKWILREESNIERLLEAFETLDVGSAGVIEAYTDFLLHLSWHQPAQPAHGAEGDPSFTASEERNRFLGSFGKRVLRSFSDNVLGQKVIDRFDEVLKNSIMSGEESGRCLQRLGRMCELQNTLPESMCITPKRLGDLDLMHKGVFADVYKDGYKGSAVAIKVLPTYLTTDLRRVAHRFCREAVIWRYLQHPNIIPLIGVEFGGGRFSFLCKWMDHGNINEYIRKRWEVNRVRLLVDVASGLEYMHSLQLVHGDLKGANVLIDDSGRACLTDFSLSTSAGVRNYNASNTSSASVDSAESRMSFTGGGTLLWMSPELLDPVRFGITDSRPTKQSDCYALGMVVYEVLCGVVPFSGMNPMVAVRSVLEGGRPQKPGAADNLGFTDELWNMVEHCWQVHRNERPNVGEILHCLRSAVPAWKPGEPHSDGDSVTGDSDSASFDCGASVTDSIQ